MVFDCLGRSQPRLTPAHLALQEQCCRTCGSRCPVSIAAGDLNNDGKLDLVIASSGSTTLSILRGRGDGSFQPQLTTPAVSDPHQILLADFNADGKLDAITVNGSSTTDSVAALFLGKGDGTFRGAQLYTVNLSPVVETIADFNRDGALDLVTANQDSATVSVLLNTGKK